MTCMASRIGLSVLILLISALVGGPRAQLDLVGDCVPAWQPTFGSLPGFDNSVAALAVFDDGSGNGPELYVGGGFSMAGNVPASRVAKWTGSGWSALGTGFDHNVRALEIFDDESGGGPALYAGGEFKFSGAVAVNGIARWDGTNWQPLGLGVGGSTLPYVYDLEVHDDGSGPQLYAAGRFTSAGGSPASKIARWDGTAWSQVSSHVFEGNTWIEAMAGFEGGGHGGRGSDLYIGGTINNAGGIEAADFIARWDGTAWTSVGSGVDGYVSDMEVLDDGGGAGPSLYVCGDFPIAGGIAVNHVARWDGSEWSALGEGLNAVASALAIFDDASGSGPRLHAFGSFTLAGGEPAKGAARWDGSDWSPLGSGIGSFMSDGITFDDGSGPALYLGGAFTSAGGVPAQGLAKWNGTNWSCVGAGLDQQVRALAVGAVGDGEPVDAVYAGGSFLVAGEQIVNRVARLGESGWSPLGSGVNGDVSALLVGDIGSGPMLFAGGSFTTAGGLPANRVAQWDGASWSPLGSGMNSDVRALAIFDDGSGPALFAGGNFFTAGGVACPSVAKWDGGSWSPLGTGMNSGVFALTVFDDGLGAGSALVAAGFFTMAGGTVANRVASWDGRDWSPLGTGLNGYVLTLLAVADGEGGPALFAGGNFNQAGGQPTSRVARWNGSAWSTLGSALNAPVSTLAFSDGTLFLGGDFTAAGILSVSHVATWDGRAWGTLGSGTDDSVAALALLDGPQGTELLAGGRFTLAPDSGDSFLARWACAGPPPVWTDLGSGFAGVAGVPALAGAGTLEPGSPGSLTLTSAKPSSLTNLFVSFASTPAPFKGGTLVPVPPASTLSLFTNGVGSIPLSWPAWPAGLPAGTSLFFQYAIADAAAPAGVALSNALHAVTP